MLLTRANLGGMQHAGDAAGPEAAARSSSPRLLRPLLLGRRQEDERSSTEEEESARSSTEGEEAATVVVNVGSLSRREPGQHGAADEGTEGLTLTFEGWAAQERVAGRPPNSFPDGSPSPPARRSPDCSRRLSLDAEALSPGGPLNLDGWGAWGSQAEGLLGGSVSPPAAESPGCSRRPSLAAEASLLPDLDDWSAPVLSCISGNGGGKLPARTGGVGGAIFRSSSNASMMSDLSDDGGGKMPARRSESGGEDGDVEMSEAKDDGGGGRPSRSSPGLGGSVAGGGAGNDGGGAATNSDAGARGGGEERGGREEDGGGEEDEGSIGRALSALRERLGARATVDIDGISFTVDLTEVLLPVRKEQMKEACQMLNNNFGPSSTTSLAQHVTGSDSDKWSIRKRNENLPEFAQRQECVVIRTPFELAIRRVEKNDLQEQLRRQGVFCTTTTDISSPVMFDVKRSNNPPSLAALTKAIFEAELSYIHVCVYGMRWEVGGFGSAAEDLFVGLRRLRVEKGVNVRLTKVDVAINTNNREGRVAKWAASGPPEGGYNHHMISDHGSVNFLRLNLFHDSLLWSQRMSDRGKVNVGCVTMTNEHSSASECSRGVSKSKNYVSCGHEVRNLIWRLNMLSNHWQRANRLNFTTVRRLKLTVSSCLFIFNRVRMQARDHGLKHR